MDNMSHRAVIRYLGLKGLTPKEIHEDMVVTLWENAPFKQHEEVGGWIQTWHG